MNIKKEYLWKDYNYKTKEEMPYSRQISIKSKDSNLYGYVLVPGAIYQEKRPCILMFHGFPGYTTNNDLEQAFRRIGFVVFHVNHRGAWGSEGEYLFHHLVEDAVSIADWVKEHAEDFSIDTNQIFLSGHSMGGMTVLNAAKHLPYVKGVIAMAPYDLHNWFDQGEENKLMELILEEGNCLKHQGNEIIFADAKKYHSQLSIEKTYDALKNLNVLFVGAKFDDVAPPDRMIEPVWNHLTEHKTSANQKYVLLETEHSFCGNRIILAETIADWLETLDKNV